MESLHPLSNESFSYSWLINIKPPFDLESLDSGSFIEMDPDFISMRWTTRDGHDFDFGVPTSQAPVQVHADQIFSKGRILPLHLITPPKTTTSVVSGSSDQLLPRSLSVDSSKTLLSRSNRHLYTDPNGEIPSNPSLSSCSSWATPSRIMKPKLPFFRNCVKSPKKIFRKYLCFLTPLYKKVRDQLGSNSSKAVAASPRVSNASSSIEWCCRNKMFDISDEKKIYDAILHCKKSIDSREKL